MPSFLPFQETAPSQELAKVRCASKDVQLYSSPWVHGTRASAYFGPVSVETKFKHSWDNTLRLAMDKIKAFASTLGANTVVGVDITIDPFAEPPTVAVVGTAAELLPMF